MRCLILGATGQIGSNLIDECVRRNCVVTGTWYRWPRSEFLPMDLRDEEAVREVIQESQPEAIFLAAGLSQIDFAEVNPEECNEVNARGARLVAEQAAAVNAKMVYFSTSHVFGDASVARKEDDTHTPLNVYGQAASEAESEIRRILPESHLILRTSHVFGPEERGRNVASSLVRRMGENRVSRVAVDRNCQPTYAPDLANAALELVARNLNGTFHAVGPDRMTEYAFAQLTAFIHGFDSDLIQAAKSDRLGEDAPRARTHWLERSRLRGLLGAKAFRGPAEALRHLRDQAEIPVSQESQVA